ncbi:MAG TPA: di-heme enzyme [Candidatus Binatia bacterium]|nr:di-heme enzyme [Candidatus Binatia bacterium]
MHTRTRSGLARLAIAGVLALGFVCVNAHRGVATEYKWNLPIGFPTPKVPDDNPITVEKVALGRFVFYDTRMSGNQTYACASCHKQELAFTDGLPQAVGSTGQMHPRGSMSLANVAYAASLAWANPLLLTLEQQVLIPMFGDNPVELGLGGMETELVDRFQSSARYRRMFAEAFPDESETISVKTITYALASFVRTLISGGAPYDRFVQGLDDTALSESAQRGARLLFTERFDCFHCHNGFDFAISVTFAGKPIDETSFQNNGLYNIGGTGAYPPNNTGVYAISHVPTDMGAFKAPTLRNIELTAPYMHDGSVATLDDVLDHYAAGGRTITDGPYAGDGSKNPFKNGFVHGFSATAAEREDFINFLKSLTDHDFVTSPQFSNPFTGQFCGGDCDLSGSVSVNELVTSVNVALGTATLAECVTADADGDGLVTVDELVAVVNHALGGCPATTASATTGGNE